MQEHKLKNIETRGKYMVVEKYLNAAVAPWFKQPDHLTATVLYLRLSLSAINSDGTGFTEPDASSGYQPYPIPINATNWTAAVNGVVTNTQTILMNTITINSGTATHWFLSESANGNAVIFDKFKEPRPLVVDSNIQVNPGELRIGVQNIIV